MEDHRDRGDRDRRERRQRSGTAEVRITLADFCRQARPHRHPSRHEHGVCGLHRQVDGVDVRSCLMLAAQAQGEVLVEGWDPSTSIRCGRPRESTLQAASARPAS
jgi:hypothetical protein